MSESPTETLRRAARTLRIDGCTFEPGSRKRTAYFALADWLEAETEDTGKRRTRAAAAGLEMALAIARIYLNEENQ